MKVCIFVDSSSWIRLRMFSSRQRSTRKKNKKDSNPVAASSVDPAFALDDAQCVVDSFRRLTLKK